MLLPLLLLLVFGIIDFGRGINTQITLTQAAREGARLAALGQPNVVSGTQAAATGLNLTPGDISVTPCPANATQTTAAVVKVNYSFSFITPVGAIAALFGGNGFPSRITLTATGEMPCES